ncbi:MAG: family transporter substrate-binding protein [Ramlibacter sp.]|nr:family transporter substrate-binding protein [Ramlibacter sp.]
MHRTSLSRRSLLKTASMIGAGALPLPLFAAGRKLKVVSIWTGPIDQQWNSRTHVALVAAQKRADIEYTWAESIATADLERVIRQYAQQGVDMIFTEVYSMERQARAIAKAFPKTVFMVGSSLPPQSPNLSIFDDTIEEASYLSGLIAGGLTKTNVIGLVAGYPIPVVNRLMNGFMQGAREVNREAKFLVTFIGTWYDPPKAKEAAFAQIAAKADVVYAERTGAADAAKERKVLAIGGIVDTQPQFPDTVVVSALWHMEPTVERSVKKVRDGTFTGEDYRVYSALKYGGSSLSPYGTFENKVPQELKDLVKKRQEEIRTGKFVVKSDETQPKSTL